MMIGKRQGSVGFWIKIEKKLLPCFQTFYTKYQEQMNSQF